jgi:hypothetical protein
MDYFIPDSIKYILEAKEPMFKEIDKLKIESKDWKDAWYNQRKVTGEAIWSHYYSGAKAQENNNVYGTVRTEVVYAFI